jgi:hypothetical protein
MNLPPTLSECKCTLAISITGDGCRHCQPQTYIDILSRQADDMAKEAIDNESTINGLMGSVITETVRADQLQSLAMDYAMLCGELSKGLSPMDDEWIQLRDLGERLDALFRIDDEAIKHEKESP